MKQHITQEQWDEIGEKAQNMFCASIGLKSMGCSLQVTNTDGSLVMSNELPSIGHMIEFIDVGDYDLCILKNNSGSSVWKGIYVCGGSGGEKERLGYGVELCDALWEAVKNKL